MKLPIYADKIEIVKLPPYLSDVKYEDGREFSFISDRGYEVYVNGLLVAHAPAITWYPEGNR